MILDSLDADLKNIVAGLAKKANLSLSKEIDLSLIHISEPTRHAQISYAVFCLKKKL